MGIVFINLFIYFTVIRSLHKIYNDKMHVPARIAYYKNEWKVQMFSKSIFGCGGDGRFNAVMHTVTSFHHYHKYTLLLKNNII